MKNEPIEPNEVFINLNDDSENYSNEEQFINAVEDSEALLAYASEQGLDAQRADIEAIISAKFAIEKNKITKDIEVDFWLAYKSLSKIVHPVSIASIKATQRQRIKKPSWIAKLFKRKYRPAQTAKAVRTNTTLAVISLAIMLILQIFYLRGLNLLTTIQTKNIRASEIEKRITQLSIMSVGSERTASIETEQLESENGELQNAIGSSIELLADWLAFGRFFRTSDKYDAMLEKQIQEEEDVIGPPVPSKRQVDRNVMIIQDSQNYILILGFYILPLFYGLLGGFVFVLRSLADEIKTRIYTIESNIKFWLRINLGGLAGLAVGLFWNDIDQQQIKIISSMSLVLVAFLAGYSVEFIFAALDKVIYSFMVKKVDASSANEKTTNK